MALPPGKLPKHARCTWKIDLSPSLVTLALPPFTTSSPLPSGCPAPQHPCGGRGSLRGRELASPADGLLHRLHALSRSTAPRHDLLSFSVPIFRNRHCPTHHSPTPATSPRAPGGLGAGGGGREGERAARRGVALAVKTRGIWVQLERSVKQSGHRRARSGQPSFTRRDRALGVATLPMRSRVPCGATAIQGLECARVAMGSARGDRARGTRSAFRDLGQPCRGGLPRLRTIRHP
jgi:hypothetical protein